MLAATITFFLTHKFYNFDKHYYIKCLMNTTVGKNKIEPHDTSQLYFTKKLYECSKGKTTKDIYEEVGTCFNFIKTSSTYFSIVNKNL